VDPGDSLGDFRGFMLDSEMGLLDFLGLEFCWSWWPAWMCLCAFRLAFSWRYWECVLVGVQVSKPSLGRGWFHVMVWTQVSTALGDFVTFR